MSKYEIISRPFPDEITGGTITRFVIRDNETKLYFASYDSMGSVDWVKDVLAAYYMVREEAELTRNDLEAADEDFDQKLDAIIHDPETWNGIKRFLEKIGCTNVTISDIKEG